MYILGVATVRPVHRSESLWRPPPTPRPCAHCWPVAICTSGWRATPATLEDGALDRPLRWVHSSDLADPTPFLSEGLALLTTGTQFQDAADDPSVYADYVRRLSARGVVGLGFGTEVVRAGIPPLLADACRAARMPLFEVPYRTPFIAVARAGAEAIAAQSYARRSWALAAQRAISLAALRPDGLGATLAELARQLDAWVGMFDAAGTLTREHPSRARAGRGRRAAAPRWAWCCGAARAPDRRCASAACPSRCRRSAAAGTCAA